jgi:hypothetical protein
MKTNKRASKVDGKKYVLVTADEMFGPTVLYAEIIAHFPVRYRNMVKEHRAAIWRAENNMIFRVGLNGRICH